MRSPYSRMAGYLCWVPLVAGTVWPSTSGASVTTSSAMLDEERGFRVRNRRLHVLSTSSQGEHVQRRDQSIFDEITFSDEGEPLQLPSFKLQLFPTPPNPLTEESQLVLELALQDYLLSHFEALYPDTGSGTQPELASVKVMITSFSGVTSSGPVRQRSLQETGTEIDVDATLNFIDSNFPSASDLEGAMDDALVDNFDVFVDDFLDSYATAELAGIDSGVYTSGFTQPPTVAPTPAPTTKAPTATIAALNDNVPVNAPKERRMQALYPAVICGVAVFLLTTLFLAYRRNRIKAYTNEDSFDEDYSIDHISIDYDGREEAHQLELERQERERQTERSELQELRDLREMERQQIQGSQPPRRKGRSRAPMEGAIQSQAMRDGSTTLHVPPVMEARSASRRYQASTMVVSSASSSVGTYDYEDGFDTSAVGSASTDWSTVSNVEYPYESDRKLPSMMGGSEFGTRNAINRGLI